MYRATLKEGKTYHVGGVTFTKGTPRVVPDELGEYLKTVAVFEVGELSVPDKTSGDLPQVLTAKGPSGDAQAVTLDGSLPTTGLLEMTEDRKSRKPAKRGK